MDGLEPVADALSGAGERLDRSPLGGLLRGDWIGHPLHPALTDLPIGCWTSAAILDVVGGRRSRTAATRLIGLGLLTVVPTAAAGLVDVREVTGNKRRSGAAHAISNSVATLLYFASWRARRRGHHVRGVVLGMMGAAAASAGGALGGHLAFGTSTDERSADDGGQAPAGAGTMPADIDLAPAGLITT